MSRTLSANAVASLNSLQTGSAWFFLVQIAHADLPAPYRYVNNTTDVSSMGQVWTAYPFALTLAVDDGATLPSVAVQFDNVDRELIDVIRGLVSAPSVNLYLVLSNAPDVVEMSLADMQLVDIEFDLQSISGRLVSGDLLNAPYPCDSYEPAQFPGIFFLMRDLTRFVGIPYKDKGTDPALGLDCWQLVRLFYREVLGLDVPDYMAFYESSLDFTEASAAIVHALPEWQRVDEARYGDVLVFRIQSAPWHTAVALEGGLMLHTDEGHGSVIESRTSLRWRDRFFGAYRWTL